MGVSIVIAVRNEECSIKRLLDCIKQQSMFPDEIIIVDGGSTDKTVELINMNKSDLPLKVLQIGPALPGKGRNHAIAQSNNEIVAIADAGIEIGIDWLKSLVEPFKHDSNLEVVFGGYRPLCRNSFLKATALFVASDKDPQFGFRFPAMPSMAIKKNVYLKLGGCPEDLRAAEDSVFFRRLFEYNPNFSIAKDAIIDWEMDNSWHYLIRKNFHAAKYEILGGYIRKRSIILMILYLFIACLILVSFSRFPMLSVVPLIFFSIRITGSKRMDPELYGSLVSSLTGILWLAVVTLVSDIAHIAGNITGFFFYFKAQDKPKLHLWQGARFQNNDHVSPPK